MARGIPCFNQGLEAQLKMAWPDSAHSRPYLFGGDFSLNQSKDQILKIHLKFDWTLKFVNPPLKLGFKYILLDKNIK
jgi:hypothetical protein